MLAQVRVVAQRQGAVVAVLALLGEEVQDGLDGDLRRHFPVVVTAHAVGDDVDAVSLADVEIILVVGPEEADIGRAESFYSHHHHFIFLNRPDLTGVDDSAFVSRSAGRPPRSSSAWRIEASEPASFIA